MTCPICHGTEHIEVASYEVPCPECVQRYIGEKLWWNPETREWQPTPPPREPTEGWQILSYDPTPERIVIDG